MNTYERHHHHKTNYNLNLNGVLEAYVHARRYDEGILYYVVTRRVVYDHTEETRALSFDNECAAQAVANSINTIVQMLGRFDADFARTLEDPDEAHREAVADTVHSPFADGYIPH